MAQAVEQAAPQQAPARAPSAEERLRAYLETEDAPEAPEQAAEAPESEEAAEVGEAPEDEAAEAAGGDEAPEQKEAAEPEEADADAIEVSSLADLAEHLGVEVADLYNVSVPVTLADGTKREITIGEYKDSVHESDKLKKAQAELAQKRAELDRVAGEQAEAMRRSLAQTHSLVETLEKQLLADMEAVDWNALRTEDPSEWAAKRQEYMDRNQALEKAKQAALERLGEFQGKQQEDARAAYAEMLQREQAALSTAIPDWSDPEKAKAEKAALRGFLKESGFSDEESGSIADHRLVVLARKAMLYDQNVSKADAAKKRVLKIGTKVLKPGAKQSKGQQQQDRTRALRSRLRKSGKVDDAAKLIGNLL